MTKLMDNLEEPNIEPKNKLHRNFITMAEDGLLIVWDLKKVLNWEDKTHFFIKQNSKWEPVFVISFSRRNQSTDELGGSQILIDIKESKINKEKKL